MIQVTRCIRFVRFLWRLLLALMRQQRLTQCLIHVFVIEAGQLTEILTRRLVWCL